jgi:hypothetical protein
MKGLLLAASGVVFLLGILIAAEVSDGPRVHAEAAPRAPSNFVPDGSSEFECTLPNAAVFSFLNTNDPQLYEFVSSENDARLRTFATLPEGWSREDLSQYCAGQRDGEWREKWARIADLKEHNKFLAEDIAEDESTLAVLAALFDERDGLERSVEACRSQLTAQQRATHKSDYDRRVERVNREWEIDRQREHERVLATIDHNARVLSARESAKQPVVVVPGYQRSRRFKTW